MPISSIRERFCFLKLIPGPYASIAAAASGLVNGPSMERSKGEGLSLMTLGRTLVSETIRFAASTMLFFLLLSETESDSRMRENAST